MQYLAVVVLMGVLSLGDAKYAYTEVAATADGQPCVTDCIDGKCIVDKDGNEKTCISSGVKAPKMTFSTCQRLGNHTSAHCLSNCGLFGFRYEWCYTSEEGDWDFCNSSTDRIARTIDMRSCKGPCTRNPNYNYAYLCEEEDGDDYPCAPPATSNEPKVDKQTKKTCSLPETNP